MIIQKPVGSTLGILSLIVFGGNLINGNTSLDVFAVLLSAVVLFLTCIKANTFSKLLQVLVIFLMGVLVAVSPSGNTGITVIIFSCAYVLVYTYDFLKDLFEVKSFLYLIAVLLIYYIRSDNVISAILYTSFCVSLTIIQYIITKHFVDKAKELDDLKLRLLQSELTESRHTLELTIKAGMLLVKEIKNKGGK